MRHVAVLGGGVAGLTAAHELAERGVAVSLHERGAIVGGKARTIRVPGSGRGGRPDLPGEHGFRFFPGFYRHVMDTMRRIPFGQNPGGVRDNLVDVRLMGLTRPASPFTVMPACFPRDLAGLRRHLGALVENPLGVEARDLPLGLRLLWELASASQDHRRAALDPIPWGQLAGNASGSGRYRELIASTLPFVALKAEDISSSTTGTVMIQMLRAMMLPGGCADRVLCGPTSEAWIEPWREQLCRLGVTFHTGREITSLAFDGARVCGARCRDGSLVTADAYVAALPVERMAALVSPALAAADPALARLPDLARHTRWMVGLQFFLRRAPAMVAGHYLHTGSPWALTSVLHQRFWREGLIERCGDGSVRAVLSVDISDWDAPGLNGKAARDCSRDEIIAEVWRQLCDAFAGSSGTMLDASDIAHAFLPPGLRPAAGGSEASYDEPLLVNAAGTWALRPEPGTRVSNLVLAGDYVRTHIELACMEGANQSARSAVNELLARSGSPAAPCPVWPLRELPGFMALQAARAALRPASKRP